MKKPTINITKIFFANFSKHTKGDIQLIRFYFYLFSIRNKLDKIYDREAYNDAFSYMNNGKRKYLINWNRFIALLSETTPHWKYDNETRYISFNWNEDIFFINQKEDLEYDKKLKEYKMKDGTQYIATPYTRIDLEEWEIMKLVTWNKMKIYIYIILHRLRGSYKFITVNWDELRNTLKIKYNKGKFKTFLVEYLHFLKSNSVIYEFSIHKDTLTIQKRK